MNLIIDLPQGESVLCAVSGGADSIALLHKLRSMENELKISVCAAHFNHCLRGAESDSDERFVRNFCLENNIPFLSGCGDVNSFAAENGMSIEEAARELRYSFLADAAGKLNCGFIATAHNLDDNTETVLLNLIRGTGLKGLCGIPARREYRGVTIIRPLLNTGRSEIEAYLKENGLDHVEDSTNAGDDYSRNVIRHKVIPVLRAINSSADTAVYRSSELLREDEGFLSSLAESFISENLKNGSLPLKPLRKLPYSISSRVIRMMCPRSLSRTHVDAVIKLIQTGGVGFADLPGIRLTKENNRLFFGKDEKFTRR